MDRTFTFRRAMSARFLAIFGGTAMVAACGGSVVNQSSASASGAGGAGGSTQDGQGGSTQAGPVGPTSTGAGGSGTVVACYMPPPNTATCPPVDDPSLPINFPVSPCGSPTVFFHQLTTVPDANGQCCYDVYLPDQACGTGRPYYAGGSALSAPRSNAEGWASDLSPSLDGLSTAQRDALAEAWTRDALMEHASIASFGRFALELLAMGAPADLVEEAHRAALDEARHARLCFSLASTYAGERVAPGNFPLGGKVEIATDLAALAAAATREGCIGETLAAIVAAEQLASATDPAVRAVLEVIASDEAGHAALAWRAVAWAIAIGGDDVRGAVAKEMANAARALPADAAPAAESLSNHGRLDPAELRAAMERGLADVVIPCASSMLRDPWQQPPSRGRPLTASTTPRSDGAARRTGSF